MTRPSNYPLSTTGPRLVASRMAALFLRRRRTRVSARNARLGRDGHMSTVGCGRIYDQALHLGRALKLQPSRRTPGTVVHARRSRNMD